MCYADTDTHTDGTATAFCYCGWSTECPTVTAAEHTAADHETTATGADNR